jgi:electron transport complex, RnfABCDGE type, E subunit
MNKQKTRPLAILKNGMFNENPTFRLLLGMCPTLAITTAAVNGIGMGLAAMFVLVGSNVFVSLLRNFIPPKVRIPAFVLIIAAFVTIVQLVLKAYMPALDKALGLYIPLIVVNCIIIARAEAFAYKNTVWASLLDGIGVGLGFTAAIVLIASIREILGNGTIFGAPLFGDRFLPAIGMISPSGGFITLGLLIGLINKLVSLRQKKKGAH